VLLGSVAVRRLLAGVALASITTACSSSGKTAADPTSTPNCPVSHIANHSVKLPCSRSPAVPPTSSNTVVAGGGGALVSWIDPSAERITWRKSKIS
jgi:hypothetical protein